VLIKRLPVINLSLATHTTLSTRLYYHQSVCYSWLVGWVRVIITSSQETDWTYSITTVAGTHTGQSWPHYTTRLLGVINVERLTRSFFIFEVVHATRNRPWTVNRSAHCYYVWYINWAISHSTHPHHQPQPPPIDDTTHQLHCHYACHEKIPKSQQT